MAEWSNAAVLKTAEPETVPGVRIPLLPPLIHPKVQQNAFILGLCRLRFDCESYQFLQGEYQND